MAVSDAWLSRSLREAMRDKGASHGPTVAVDIYAFAKFKNAYTEDCFFFFYECWWSLVLKCFTDSSNKLVDTEGWIRAVFLDIVH